MFVFCNFHFGNTNGIIIFMLVPPIKQYIALPDLVFIMTRWQLQSEEDKANQWGWLGEGGNCTSDKLTQYGITLRVTNQWSLPPTFPPCPEKQKQNKMRSLVHAVKTWHTYLWNSHWCVYYWEKNISQDTWHVAADSIAAVSVMQLQPKKN